MAAEFNGVMSYVLNNLFFSSKAGPTLAVGERHLSRSHLRFRVSAGYGFNRIRFRF